ncbi:MAG: hypothetical protein HUJ53_10790 [Holdemanella sp.]|nr:hypothetical protein [Holdemanella sp.]
MANMKKAKKSTKVPRNQRRKQGHKLVLFTFIIIAIPCAIVGYILFTSMNAQNKPVEGNRFAKEDLNPAIKKADIDNIVSQLEGTEGIDKVTATLTSATLRIHIDMTDDSNTDAANAKIEEAYTIVDSVLPVADYFTNKENSKMYDLSIDAYNYIVDEVHPLSNQVYLQLTKTGAGKKVVDNLNSPKNQGIVDQIVRTQE